MSSPKTDLPTEQYDGTVAFIGGSSFLASSYLSSFDVIQVETKFGPVVLRANSNRTIYFVQRHAANPAEPYSPPHLINHRAIMTALVSLNVRRVIAFGSVGALKKTIPVGTLMIIDDYVQFDIISTFEYSKAGHLVPGLDKSLRTTIADTLSSINLPYVNGGVYYQSKGPRFETPAEIRTLALTGDVVGMTCGHEAALAKELGIAYAVLCMVDNMANGVSDLPFSEEEFHAGLKRNLATMEKVLGALLSAVASRIVPPANTTNRTQVDLMVHARYVVPIVPAGTLEYHTLVVKDGKIVDLLPTDAAQTKYTATQVEHMSQNHVLMPGLVNCHTHVGMTLMRGFADDYCLHTWLTEHIWPAEAEFCSPEFVTDGTNLAVAEMIRGGTTCINDMYFFPESICKVIESTGIRATIGLIVMDFPTKWAKDVDNYIALGEALRQQYVAHPRIKFAYAPHAPYTVCDANLERVRNLHAETKKNQPTEPHKIHIHLHETLAEVVDSEKGLATMSKHRSDHLCRPVANIDRIGLLTDDLLAVHMTQLNEKEIALVAAKKGNVVHCPSSNMKLSSGFCPIWPLLKAGANVALGTDSTASNNGLDMFAEIRAAALISKGITSDATAVPAQTALELATINGARALGLSDQIGSLEVGKSADFIAVNFSDLELAPIFDVVSHLVYAASRDKVSDVWCGGRRLLQNRTLTTLNEQEVVTRARSWQTKMSQYRNTLLTKRSASQMDATN